MHARTQLRKSVQARLIAANVAGGAVYLRDPRGAPGFDRFPFVVIEPAAETDVSVKGPRAFGPRLIDRKLVGRLMRRPVKFSATVVAKETGTEDEFGNLVTLEKDADEVADDISAHIEIALFDGSHRLMIKDSNGAEVRLGESDLVLLGTSGLINPETGFREIGTVHHLFEAVLLTSEGDPETIVGGQNRTQ